MRHACVCTVLAFLAVAGFATDLFARDTALLMALTYRNAPDPDLAKKTLPGTTKDLTRMRDVVQTLGFEDVRVLTDGQATYKGIRDALTDIARTVKANDRVLIYYSGHGSRLPDNDGDEADGYDEGLIPFDFTRANPGAGRPQPLNFFRDDEFGELLRAIPSNRVFVILDSCHSGTGTRVAGFVEQDEKIRFFDSGIDPNTASRRADTVDDLLPRGIARDRFVNLMAAKDVETAKERSSVGGLFTTALVEFVQKARQDSVCVVPLDQMFTRIQSQVVREAENMRSNQQDLGPQTPQLEADDPALRNQTIELRGIQGCSGPKLTDRMRYWSDFAGTAKEKLQLTTNATAIQPHPAPDARDRCASQVGLLALEVTAPRDGYLTVLNIGEGDSEATVIFPNNYIKDGKVQRGQKLMVPPSGGTWCLPARLPANRDSEEVLVIAIFSETYLNPFESGTGSGPFRQVGSGSRSFSAVAGRAAGFPDAAAQTVVTIKK